MTFRIRIPHYRAIPVLAVILLLAACFRREPAPYTPIDPALRAFPLSFYPAVDTTVPAKAFVFFVGNDIGFWGAHQDLAKRLAGSGYDVVGFDTKIFFDRLPEDTIARARAYADSVTAMLARARRELHAESLPVVIGGHSLGAELASWIAVHAQTPGLKGVLLISTRPRGHIRATLADITNGGLPNEPGSFAVAEQIAAIAPDVRIAMVRGTDDRFRNGDPALLKAGGTWMDKWSVPWGGHSMSNILLAGPFVERALAWTLAR